jgi:hypothetical protein
MDMASLTIGHHSIGDISNYQIRFFKEIPLHSSGKLQPGLLLVFKSGECWQRKEIPLIP